MSTVRCPQCQLLTTDAERQAGVCPECGAALPMPARKAPAEPETPRDGPSPLPLMLVAALAIVLFLTGGAGGYALATIRWAGDEIDLPLRPKVEDAADAQREETEAAKLAKRLKDAHILFDKHRLDFQAQEKRSEQARQTLNGRIKELETKLAKADDDLTAQKKQTAAEKARAESAERDADMLRAEGKKPQDKLLEAVTKKFEAQTKLTQIANARADAAQRNTDQVRNLGERQLEQQRQESQRQLEQLRQENQRQLEQVRQQLRLQQQMTEQARADANRHKQAADELRRKLK